ncbi:hypothetical protein B7494_g7895 [Chlorociboria aeruginascens]|nr:hypothetical protein B7494_g7895 [Chlorociboria aeruginascens]
MSMVTIATLPRLSSNDLSKILLEANTSNLDAQAPPEKLAVIDVRDDGGHIKHSIHVPSQTLDHKIPELVRKLKDKEVVIFHCALSQQRGPSAALRYIRERDRLLGRGPRVGEAMKKNKEEEEMGAENKGDKDWEDVEPESQKVYVLDRGFVGWQERFGEDSRLTEGYRKEIWKDGYWM